MLHYIHQLAANFLFLLFIAEQWVHMRVLGDFLHRKTAAPDMMKAANLSYEGKMWGCKAEP